MNMLGGPVYRLLEWITKFAYIQLLWVIFTLAGGLILGFFPSTVALFAVVRRWLLGEGDIPLFTTFWSFYKKEFLKSNVLGLLTVSVGLLISINVYFMQINTLDLLKVTYIPIMVFILIYVLFLLYLFPAFVHFDVKMLHVIKNAFLIMLISPLQTLFMIIALVAMFFVMRAVPALGFIFGGSCYAFITMWLSLNAFTKVERKTKHYERA